jgi:hypothetical protein
MREYTPEEIRAIQSIHNARHIYEDQLAIGLRTLFAIHSVISAPALNKHTPIEDLRTYTLALFVEIGEFLQEFDWKPWRTKEARPHKAVEEFADILAFIGVLMNIMILLIPGLSIDKLVVAYMNKVSTIVERMADATKE